MLQEDKTKLFEKYWEKLFQASFDSDNNYNKVRIQALVRFTLT